MGGLAVGGTAGQGDSQNPSTARFGWGASASADKAGPALAAVGGRLVLIGSFMPRASIATAFGTISIAGTEGDGKITLAVGLAMVLL